MNDKLKELLKGAEESTWLEDIKHRNKYKRLRRIKFKIQALYYIMKRKFFTLFMHFVSKSFYCQREIEGNKICKEQCDHCKEYYAPLERQ